MAARRKSPKQTALDLEGQSDPRAPLDSKKLLGAAQPVLRQLAEDLLGRAKASKAVTAALEARHQAEQAQRRTADPFVVWQTNLVDQVAAAWLLSCVFVRTLEDRGLLGGARLAGPGAADSQRQFLDLAPSLGERDYLLTVFRELSRFPAARDLFDAKHNPVWLLTPSAEAAKALLGLFRLPSPEAPTFRFGQDDTRFLGDLYQDLNEVVQKRYALLQTPRFVESFILDRTLERAIERFGLNDTTAIDPTCGSGHFLLGSFERLYEHRLLAEPGLGEREAARKALDAVYGSDINPYAVAIARFRLTLAFLDRAGFKRLEGAPALPLHLVVADSLLHNMQQEQASFLELPGQSAEAWAGQEFALEDERAAREILHRKYAAVVGNPPYITVKDAILRERYREMYVSAAGKYSLAAPFAQRFFQLARDGGCVGMITANSFMKREFGKKLIEEYLPSVNLDLIVNTADAEIPGHGTPTVLLFGTNEKEVGADVVAVLARRGEPTVPQNPDQGLVWRSIVEHWQEHGFENDFISVARLSRVSLAKHPWSLGGGGAGELKAWLEEHAPRQLGQVVSSIGPMAITGEDDCFVRARDAWLREGAEAEWILDVGIGEEVRDWAHMPSLAVAFPYRDAKLRDPREYPGIAKILWPYRRTLLNRPDFGGKTYIDVGRSWYEFHQVPLERLRVPMSIAFGEIATHNHFVLDRGGKVFNRTAPLIKLPKGAAEEDHLALLAYLNSSTACFWMKQVSFQKSAVNARGDAREKPERISYQFAGTPLAKLPIPKLGERLPKLASMAVQLAETRATYSPSRVISEWQGPSADELRSVLRDAMENESRCLEELIGLQEEIDWTTYVIFDLAPVTSLSPSEKSLGTRLADVPSRYGEEPPECVAMERTAVWKERRRLIESNDTLRQLEHPMYKRPWVGTQGQFHRGAWSFEDQVREACRSALSTAIEQQFRAGDHHVMSVVTVAASIEKNARTLALAELLAGNDVEDASYRIRKNAG